MIYRIGIAQTKKKQNSLYYLIHVGFSTPSSPSRSSVDDWNSDTSIGKHVHIFINVYLNLLYIGLDPLILFTTVQDLTIRLGSVEKTLTSMQDTVRMLQEQIGRMYSPRYLYLD